MAQEGDFKQRFKRAVTGNFDLSVEETERFEAGCGLFGWLTTRLLSLVPPLPEGTILDVGCGTGISTKAIIDSVQKGVGIAGVDISPVMLREAKIRCAEVDFVLGDAELLSSICSGPFGGIYYTASIFLFPDVETSLKEASKIMAPGGAVAGSYMETMQGKDGEDLIASAKVNYPDLMIRHRKLFSFEELSTSFKKLFKGVVEEEIRFKMGRKDAEAFFSIPAQSASLFPGEPVEVRLERVRELFRTLNREEYVILWKLVGGRK